MGGRLICTCWGAGDEAFAGPCPLVDTSHTSAACCSRCCSSSTSAPPAAGCGNRTGRRRPFGHPDPLTTQMAGGRRDRHYAADDRAAASASCRRGARCPDRRAEAFAMAEATPAVKPADPVKAAKPHVRRPRVAHAPRGPGRQLRHVQASETTWSDREACGRRAGREQFYPIAILSIGRKRATGGHHKSSDVDCRHCGCSGAGLGQHGFSTAGDRTPCCAG